MIQRPIPTVFIAQTVLAGCALAACEQAGFSWFSLGVLALTALVMMVRQMATVSLTGAIPRAHLTGAWLLLLLFPGVLSLIIFGDRILGGEYATGVALLTLAFLPASDVAVRVSLSKRCGRFASLLTLLSGGVWLVYSYRMNLRGGFLAASGLLVMGLVLGRLCFRLRPLFVQTAHTLILLLIALPLADHFIQPHNASPADLDPAAEAYSYKAAVANPVAYARWHRYTNREWFRVSRILFYTKGVPEILHQKLQPDARCQLFRSDVSINHLGFRGREIAVEKGNTYRIVALGESTTFGITLIPGDRPWPDRLEEMIRERLHPARPVEVINAGVPGYNLEQNLYRLVSDILPLKPDLIISYHGLNGFKFIFPSLPDIAVRDEELLKYYPRPLTLLGDVEFKLRILWNQQSRGMRLRFRQPECSRPMETRYARDYEQLIGICRTNGIQLALANYSMAVNARSDPQVLHFYRRIAPEIGWEIAANEVHSEILRELTRQNPDVWLVDTHPGLDGKYDNFADRIHFTAPGRQRMAETMFEGLQAHLQGDLSRPGPAGN